MKYFKVLFSLACILTACVISLNAQAEVKRPGKSRTEAKESLDEARGRATSKPVQKEAATLKGFGPIVSHGAEIIGLFSLSDGTGALAVDRSGTVATWSGTSANGSLVLSLKATVTAAASDPGKGLLAIASEKGVIIYSSTYQELYKKTDLKTRVSAMSFTPDSESLLIGGSDGMIYRWRFGVDTTDLNFEESTKLFERYFAHATVVSQVAFHPFGRVFFSSDWGGAVYAWLRFDADPFGGQYDKNVLGSNMFSGTTKRMKLERKETEPVEILRLSGDGKMILLGTQDGMLEVWKVRGLKKESSIQAHKGLIYDAQFSNDGQKIISSGRDGKIKVWEIVRELDPTGGPDLWTLEVLKEISGSGFKRLIVRPNGSCIGTQDNGKVAIVPDISL